MKFWRGLWDNWMIILIHFRKHETAAVITEWLRIESHDKHESKNTLLSFFIIFIPVGAMHAVAHAFNYVQNPDQS